MQTHLWRVDPASPDRETIKKAAQIITGGGLVAFPTETVYGLGANGLDPAAVTRVFEAKGRPADNPLILHIANQKDVFYLAGIVPLKAQVLIENFWPGPLTLVFSKGKFIPAEVTGGLDTVAIRMPRHNTALALIREAGVPLAGPSANRSGYPSPTEALHVWNDLQGKIEAILDAGPAGLGLESTVLDVSGEIPVILRPGGVTREELEQVVGTVEIDPGLVSAEETPKSPGMKYTHYAPRAEVFLIDGTIEETQELLNRLIPEQQSQGRRVGLLLTEETYQKFQSASPAAADYLAGLGPRSAPDKIAHNLYRELRNADKANMDVIYAETHSTAGLGAALMNRLLKSSGYKVLHKDKYK